MGDFAGLAKTDGRYKAFSPPEIRGKRNSDSRIAKQSKAVGT
jgi:hypothetical protein